MSDNIQIDGEIEAFLRQRLAERLSKIAAPQRAKLAMILSVDEVFPDSLRRSSLERAIDLCDRQIRKDGQAVPP